MFIDIHVHAYRKPGPKQDGVNQFATPDQVLSRYEEGIVPKLMRRYPNLYGDLSAGSGYNALARDPDYAVPFIVEFQDRLLFGTDLCTSTQPVPQIDFLLGLRDDGRISEVVFQRIARENAIKLLELER